MKINNQYIASLTREPFMFYEMKLTASLLNQNFSENEIIEKIVRENLYQYPTERTLRVRAKACLRRLQYIDTDMQQWIETKSIDVAKQICLYALMQDSRLIREFFITVIGEKYETKDFSYSRDIIKQYFIQLQEQNEKVASWSEETIKKLSSVISNILKDVGYIDDFNSSYLNELLIDYQLKEKIIKNHDTWILPAFNEFGVKQ